MVSLIFFSELFLDLFDLCSIAIEMAIGLDLTLADLDSHPHGNVARLVVAAVNHVLHGEGDYFSTIPCLVDLLQASLDRLRLPQRRSALGRAESAGLERGDLDLVPVGFRLAGHRVQPDVDASRSDFVVEVAVNNLK